MGSRDDSKQKTILVVDDNPANLGVISDFLTESGYRVLSARDGESGLESAGRAKPDLILLDVKLPGLDGFEVCRRLKQTDLGSKIPVIFVSALGEADEKLQGFKAGGSDYITKPFNEREILARVNTHLALRELTENLEQKVAERTSELRISNRKLKQEISERGKAEERITKLFSLLSAIRDINQQIVTATDAGSLMQQACRILVRGQGVHERLHRS